MHSSRRCDDESAGGFKACVYICMCMNVQVCVHVYGVLAYELRLEPRPRPERSRTGAIPQLVALRTPLACESARAPQRDARP